MERPKAICSRPRVGGGTGLAKRNGRASWRKTSVRRSEWDENPYAVAAFIVVFILVFPGTSGGRGNFTSWLLLYVLLQVLSYWFRAPGDSDNHGAVGRSKRTIAAGKQGNGVKSTVIRATILLAIYAGIFVLLGYITA